MNRDFGIMSQQSTSSSPVTSSRLSMASTTAESQVSDHESQLSRRWEDETEMDKSLKILKRKQAATIRLRKINSVADRILESRVRDLDSHFSRVSKQLCKETNYIRDEINEIHPVKLPRIESAEQLSKDSRSTSAMSDKSRSTSSRAVSRSSREPLSNTCLFDPVNTRWRCKHFPCYLPVTYHSMGYFPGGNSYSVVTNYKQLLGRCHDLRPTTSKERNEEIRIEEELLESTSRAPRTTVKEKLRGLKQLVKELKEKNEKQKPRDWAVNYGDPIPRRIILKPVKTVT